MEEISQKTAEQVQAFNTGLSIGLGLLIMLLYVIYLHTGELNPNDQPLRHLKPLALATFLLACMMFSSTGSEKKVFLILMIISFLLTALVGFGAWYVHEFARGWKN